jgi:hypothetical protein
VPKLNLRPRLGKPRPLGSTTNPIPLPARRVLVKKTMCPPNPFYDNDNDLMPSPNSGGTKIRIYRFLEDGSEIEAQSPDGHSWTGTVKNPDGKVVKQRSFYSEAAARQFVEEPK